MAAHGGLLTGEHQWLKHQWWFAIFGGVESSLGNDVWPTPGALLCHIKEAWCVWSVTVGHNQSSAAHWRFFLFLQAKSWLTGVTVPGLASLTLPFLCACVCFRVTSKNPANFYPRCMCPFLISHTFLGSDGLLFLSAPLDLCHLFRSPVKPGRGRSRLTAQSIVVHFRRTLHGDIWPVTF